MSWGLAQETGHVMVQGTAREGYEAISSCTMQRYKGHELVGGRGVHRDKIIHFSTLDDLADASDVVYISAGVKNLCSSAAYNIFLSLPSLSPGSAAPPVASAGKENRASSTIRARLGIPPANGTRRARTDKTEAHPTSLSIVALRRKRAFRLFSGTPHKDKMRLHLRCASSDADSGSFWNPGAARFYGKRQAEPWSLRSEDETFVYKDELRRAVPDGRPLATTKAILCNGLTPASLLPAVETAAFCRLVFEHPDLVPIFI